MSSDVTIEPIEMLPGATECWGPAERSEVKETLLECKSDGGTDDDHICCPPPEKTSSVKHGSLVAASPKRQASQSGHVAPPAPMLSAQQRHSSEASPPLVFHLVEQAHQLLEQILHEHHRLVSQLGHGGHAGHAGQAGHAAKDTGWTHQVHHHHSSIWNTNHGDVEHALRPHMPPPGHKMSIAEVKDRRNRGSFVTEASNGNTSGSKTSVPTIIRAGNKCHSMSASVAMADTPIGSPELLQNPEPEKENKKQSLQEIMASARGKVQIGFKKRASMGQPCPNIIPGTTGGETEVNPDQCVGCGNLYKDDSRFCRKCGRQRQQVCMLCSRHLKGDEKHCANCGSERMESCRRCGNVYAMDSMFCRRCGEERPSGFMGGVGSGQATFAAEAARRMTAPDPLHAAARLCPPSGGGAQPQGLGARARKTFAEGETNPRRQQKPKEDKTREGLKEEKEKSQESQPPHAGKTESMLVENGETLPDECDSGSNFDDDEDESTHMPVERLPSQQSKASSLQSGRDAEEEEEHVKGASKPAGGVRFAGFLDVDDKDDEEAESVVSPLQDEEPKGALERQGRRKTQTLDDYDQYDPHHRDVTLEVKHVWNETSTFPSPHNSVRECAPRRTEDGWEVYARYKNTALLGEGQAFANRGDFVHVWIKPIVIHPSAKGRMLWEMMGMLFLAYDLVMIPLQSIFTDYLKHDDPFIVTTTYITSTYWGADVVASFIVGYHHQGMVILDPRKIAMHYAKTWMLPDVFLVFVDVLFMFLGFGSQASFMRVGKTFGRGFRVLRLLRIVKMQSVVSSLIDKVRSDYVRTLFGIFGLVMFIVCVNHFIACGWYGIGGLNGSRSWRSRFLTDPEHDNFGYRYVTSLHWSLTQFTPASMEVFPQNGLERLYSVLVLLFALITFSSFVSSITQAMTHLRKINAQKLEQEAVLSRYLTQHGISPKMINRTWHYLHQQKAMDSRGARTKEADVAVLSRLPRSMVVELRFEAFGPDLRRHPFFLYYGLFDILAMRQICHMAVSEVSLASRQELFSDAKGEVVQMFFVVEGLLEYHLPCSCAPVDDVSDSEDDEEEDEEMDDVTALVSADEMRVVPSSKEDVRKETEDRHERARADARLRARRVDKVHPMHWACEAALWSQRVELCSPFVAASQKAEILIISTDNFLDIVMRHETSRVKVARYAMNFVTSIHLLCSCRWRTPICNDYSVLEDLVHHDFDYKLARKARMVQALDDSKANDRKVRFSDRLLQLRKSRKTQRKGNWEGDGETLDVEPPDPNRRKSRKLGDNMEDMDNMLPDAAMIAKAQNEMSKSASSRSR
eukprot:TRINITY_DN64914_c0_g1_i1.p1 TRINITY_DN64914_c0_g1~~TRINITY_DN64914_c0_g1_i1.p1  ORF type:complete len:1309 (+),score=321.86 TRINITY_DN64914_c0_g1_i1:77-4003(+)